MEIWKYEIEVTDVQDIIMPKGVNILNVQLQNGKPHIWAMVDPSAERIDKRLHVYKTGHRFTLENKRYIGTFQFWQGIWHVFEVT